MQQTISVIFEKFPQYVCKIPQQIINFSCSINSKNETAPINTGVIFGRMIVFLLLHDSNLRDMAILSPWRDQTKPARCITQLRAHRVAGCGRRPGGRKCEGHRAFALECQTRKEVPLVLIPGTRHGFPCIVLSCHYLRVSGLGNLRGCCLPP